MNTLRGSRIPESGEQPARRSVSKPLALSIGLHAILAIVLGQMLISPSSFSMIFGRERSTEVRAERIGFLRLPERKEPVVEGRSGGDGRRVSAVPPRRLSAPATVPTMIPPAPAQPATSDAQAGSGPLVGRGGPAQGIRPTYTGPRVWAAPGDLLTAPKNAKERLDSAIVSIIGPFNDSLRVAAGARQPGDWTFEKGGRKYGIDPRYIRLGKLSIPTAVLALLPINQAGNPTVNDRNRIQNQLHADIFWNAQRGMNEADFKKAVKSIRERKERERAAAESKTRQPEEATAQSPER